MRHALRPVFPLGPVKDSLSVNVNRAAYKSTHVRALSLTMCGRAVMPNDRAEAMTYVYMNLEALMTDDEAEVFGNINIEAFLIDRDDDGELRSFAAIGTSAVRSMLKSCGDTGAARCEYDHDAWGKAVMRDIGNQAYQFTRGAVFTGRNRG